MGRLAWIAALVFVAACSGDGGDPGGQHESVQADDSGTPVDDSGAGCVEKSWYHDADGDGYGGRFPEVACERPGADWIEGPTGDCDDASEGIHPGATERCNGDDDDCDGQIDLEDDDVVDAIRGHVDGDGDGYGTGPLVEVCDATGTAPDAGDCDDGDAAVHPGATELCNRDDDDCDGLTDADDPGVADATTAYADDDGDGYGEGALLTVCDAAGTAAVDGDCDDGDGAIHPGASEVCNRDDDDCDGLSDLDDPDVTDAFSTYEDADGDGYGDAAILACFLAGTSDVAGDCDDGDDAVNPDASEVCNEIDDDCDAAIDDDDDSLVSAWVPDADGDGYGDLAAPSLGGCDPPSGYVAADGLADCDDADETAYPGAVELCDDVQQDCSDASWSSDEGLATFYPAAGGWEDWTADLGAGKYGAPAEISLLDEGELVICDGTWYAELVVGDAATFTGPASLTITGLHGSGSTTLSGGADAAVLRVTAHYVNVIAQGLTMTEGDSCFGAAISTGALAFCTSTSASISWAIGYTLTLRDVRVVDNVPTFLSAFAAAYIVNGTLTLEDSTIANNSVEGIIGEGTSVYCSGDPKNDAGIWGNSSVGARLNSYGTDPLLFESDGCDFDGIKPVYTPSYDAVLYGKLGSGNFDFGDDAVFACDITSGACVK
jgi:hypothetical protein